MDSDSETESTFDESEDQKSIEVDDDDNASLDEHTESMWNKIQRLTWSNNKDFWSKLLNEDKARFQLRFKEQFIESCKTWFTIFSEFIDNDEIWLALMESKGKIYDNVEEEDEALLSAIDLRKYKLLKAIDWKQVETDLEADPASDAEENDKD